MKKYNLDKVISLLLSDLNTRQKDVLAGRYGLSSPQRMTLASIGDQYSVTRERIRQVEALAMSSVCDKFAKGNFNDLISDLKNHLSKSGGLCSVDKLSNEAKSFLISRDSQTYTNKLNFVLESSGAFKYQPENRDFHAFWYADDQSVSKANDLIVKLASLIKDRKDELIIGNGFENAFNQLVGSVNYQKPIALNYISVSKKFDSNAYNDFGLSSWPEICPKTSRDWAYLVLRKHSQPLHFTELTKHINELRPDKNTNPQTVHNELIKDQRFVLVGRGTYGLKEFNLMAGTAREVIGNILDKHGPQKSKDLIQLVLDQRMFKENTLLLNLQDRKYFKRLDDGRYTVKKA